MSHYLRPGNLYFYFCTFEFIYSKNITDVESYHLLSSCILLTSFSGLLLWLSGKESACNVGDAADVGLIPGWGRFPVGGNGNPLQYSCLGNPMGRGGWQATVLGVAKSWTQLNMHTCVNVLFGLYILLHHVFYIHIYMILCQCWSHEGWVALLCQSNRQSNFHMTFRISIFIWLLESVGQFPPEW